MSIRFSRLAIGILVVAVMALMSGRCWAIFYGLGPSKDEWGVKYDVAVTQADKDNLNVVFTLADEGRLKPFYKLELISMSKPADNQGSRMYDMRSPFELKTTADALRAGQVQIRKDCRQRHDSDPHPHRRRPATNERCCVLRHSAQ